MVSILAFVNQGMGPTIISSHTFYALDGLITARILLEHSEEFLNFDLWHSFHDILD